ncbi:MAG: hypothetical protein ACXWNI_05320 [Candidatus Limnocylindrales bacterium]
MSATARRLHAEVRQGDHPLGRTPGVDGRLFLCQPCRDRPETMSWSLRWRIVEEDTST